jgi:hypothetical protein
MEATTRRGFLAALFGAAAVAATGGRASADNGDALILGHENTSSGETSLEVSSGAALVLQGNGIENVLSVNSDRGRAISASSSRDSALNAGSDHHVAIDARSGASMGIRAIGDTYGGWFDGNRAAIHLAQNGPTHPVDGRRGDLVADTTGRLWFCKGGTTWKQLA